MRPCLKTIQLSAACHLPEGWAYSPSGPAIAISTPALYRITLQPTLQWAQVFFGHRARHWFSTILPHPQLPPSEYGPSVFSALTFRFAGRPLVSLCKRGLHVVACRPACPAFHQTICPLQHAIEPPCCIIFARAGDCTHVCQGRRLHTCALQPQPIIVVPIRALPLAAAARRALPTGWTAVQPTCSGSCSVQPASPLLPLPFPFPAPLPLPSPASFRKISAPSD